MVRRFVLIIVLSAAVLSLLWSALAAPRVLPRLRVAPGFGLQDSVGQTVSSDSLRGQTLLITFGPAHCDDPCREWSERVANAVPVQATDERVQLLWIVAEPVNVEELAQLEASLVPAAVPWRVLGSQDAQQLERILDGFRVPRALTTSGPSVDPILVIVDPTGIVRAEYRVPPQRTTLAADMAALEREIRESRSLRRYLYEAAHLFTCNVGGT